LIYYRLFIQKIIFFPRPCDVLLYFRAFIWFLPWTNDSFSVGEGFNEFDKQQRGKNFPLGFPGNNRRIDIRYSLDDVKAIR
jgi:hypothetical protein